MDAELAALGLGAFLTGATLVACGIFGRKPPLSLGFKGVVGFVTGGRPSGDDEAAEEGDLSSRERVFYGSIGGVCWALAGGFLFLGLGQGNEDGTSEAGTQPGKANDPTVEVGSDTCPPVPPDKFLIGAYYRRLQSDERPDAGHRPRRQGRAQEPRSAVDRN
jgi:hypothetical protein